MPAGTSSTYWAHTESISVHSIPGEFRVVPFLDEFMADPSQESESIPGNRSTCGICFKYSSVIFLGVYAAHAAMSCCRSFQIGFRGLKVLGHSSSQNQSPFHSGSTTGLSLMRARERACRSARSDIMHEGGSNRRAVCRPWSAHGLAPWTLRCHLGCLQYEQVHVI
jgi:hypothetical protein